MLTNSAPTYNYLITLINHYFAKLRKTLVLLLVVIFSFSFSYAQQSAVEASLHLYAPNGLVSDQTAWVGVRLTHQQGWHTYWINPGEAGKATHITLSLPVGMQAGEIQWPTPETFQFADMQSYGYSNEVLLTIPIKIGSKFNPKQNNEIKAKVNWLSCKTNCIPGSAELSTKLLTDLNPPSINELFDRTLANLPQLLKTNTDDKFYITTDANNKQQLLNLTIKNLPGKDKQSVVIYPQTAELLEDNIWQQQYSNGVWHASAKLSSFRSKNNYQQLNFVIFDPNEQQSWLIKLPLTGDWPDKNLKTKIIKIADKTTEPITLNFWLVILAAMLGGLLLNLMPCVFPILAIKSLAVVRNSKNSSKQRIEALSYSAGVIVSFILLAGLILILRQAGHTVGWGFQLQSPIVISVLISLMVVIGLNLAGLFEFGNIISGKLAGKTFNQPNVNAAFSGILSVVIATPCTAPFMGAALGMTLTMPSYQVIIVFIAMGFAMSSPFLLLCYLPIFNKFIPKPGQWMVTFKQLMAFPMLLTAIWLLWVLGQQVDSNSIINMLIVLLMLSFLLWSLSLTGKSKIFFVTIATLSLMASSHFHARYIVKLPNQKQQISQQDQLWQPWSEAKVVQSLQQGHPVFIDYTAAWCITCQYNKKTVLTNEQVLKTFANKNVVLLRADWTTQDIKITNSLAKYQRNGVPTYVILSPNKPKIILNEILFANKLTETINNL